MIAADLCRSKQRRRAITGLLTDEEYHPVSTDTTNLLFGGGSSSNSGTDPPKRVGPKRSTCTGGSKKVAAGAKPIVPAHALLSTATPVATSAAVLVATLTPAVPMGGQREVIDLISLSDSSSDSESDSNRDSASQASIGTRSSRYTVISLDSWSDAGGQMMASGPILSPPSASARSFAGEKGAPTASAATTSTAAAASEPHSWLRGYLRARHMTPQWIQHCEEKLVFQEGFTTEELFARTATAEVTADYLKGLDITGKGIQQALLDLHRELHNNITHVGQHSMGEDEMIGPPLKRHRTG